MNERLVGLGVAAKDLASDRFFGSKLDRRDQERLQLATAVSELDSLLDCLYDDASELMFEAVEHALRLASLPLLMPALRAFASERASEEGRASVEHNKNYRRSRVKDTADAILKTNPTLRENRSSLAERLLSRLQTTDPELKLRERSIRRDLAQLYPTGHKRR